LYTRFDHVFRREGERSDGKENCKGLTQRVGGEPIGDLWGSIKRDLERVGREKLDIHPRWIH
jgi:hypothetical protein